MNKLADPKSFGKTLPVQFQHPNQVLASPHERSEVNRADLLNQAEEMLMTRSLIFDFEEAQKMKHAQRKIENQPHRDRTDGVGRYSNAELRPKDDESSH